MSDLRELDEAIALTRGWFTTDLGTWTERNEPPAVQDAWLEIIMAGRENEPPPWSSSWALAGVLLEEMPRPQLALVIGDSDWRSWFCEASPNQPTEDTAQYCATPCVAIARAWLAWKRAKPDGGA